MSPEPLKSSIELEVIADQFKKSIKEAKGNLQSLDKAASKTEKNIKSLGSKANTAKSAISGLGSSANSAKGSLKSAGTAAKSMGGDLTTLATSVTGLAGGFTGLSDAVFGFAEKAVALKRSKLGLEELTTDLRYAQEDYATAVQEGTLSLRELARMEEGVIRIRKQHAIEIETVAAEENALNGEYVTFAVNIATVATQSAIMIKLLGSQAGATATLSRATKLLRIDFHTASLAMKGYSIQQTAIGTTSMVAATGIHRVSLAVKGLYMSLGPIGWTIIAVTSAWAAWETNLFGVRDATRETMKTLMGLWDVLKWIVPAIGIFDESWKRLDPKGHAENVDWWASSVNNLGRETDQAADQIQTFTGDMEEYSTVLTGIPPMVDAVTSSTNKLDQAIMGTHENLELVVNQFGDIIGVQQVRRMEQFEKQSESMFHTLNDVMKFQGNTYTETKLHFHELSSELKSFDTLASIVHGPEYLADQIRRIGNEAGYSAKQVNELLKIVNLLEKKSFDEDTVKNYDEILRNKPTGSALSSSLNIIRVAVNAKLDAELSNIRNRSGKITSEQNQAINFRFESMRRQLQKQMEFQRLQAHSQLIEQNRQMQNHVTAIKSFNAKTNNNYANPNFKSGGGFTAGSRTNRKRIKRKNRRRRRIRQESIASQYEQYFGERPNILTHRSSSRLMPLDLSGFPNIEQTKIQLEQFPVDLDFTARMFSDMIRAAIPRRLISKSGRRRNYRKRIAAVYQDILRAPTRLEAIKAALAESQKIESFYNKAVKHDSDLSQIIQQSGLSRKKFISYSQSNQEEMELTSRLAFHDRVQLEANSV